MKKSGFFSKRKKYGSSIFARIWRSMLSITLFNAFALILVLMAVGLTRQLNQNSFDILKKQVDNRSTYLQERMIYNWMNLTDLADTINAEADRMISSGEIDFDLLDSSPRECAPLINNVMDSLIDQLYARQNSGIYLTFMTHTPDTSFTERPGISIVDTDPLSTASDHNADLLLEHAPISTIRSFHLATDSSWQQNFRMGPEPEYERWLTAPWMQASLSHGALSAQDCGLWSLRKDLAGKLIITYSIPLILPDGRVYGVLGVDVHRSHMAAVLPSSELADDSVYMLLKSDQDPSSVSEGIICAVSSRDVPFTVGNILSIEKSQYGGYVSETDEGRYDYVLDSLPIYSRNAPFEDEHWYIVGAVPSRTLYAFTHKVTLVLAIALIVILCFGLVSALFSARRITRPIVALRKELEESETGSIPRLSHTGINEIDEFADAITDLSFAVIHSSRRFLSIMEMSSIEMGGYELDPSTGFVFITDNFFRFFGMNDVSAKVLTADEFMCRMKEIESMRLDEGFKRGDLYCVVDHLGDERYIHMQESVQEGRHIGLVEDVTSQVSELRRIEHDRDYDPLTEIYNRRAFYRNAEAKLRDRASLSTACVLMFDLDNLKILNDTYGHEWGDRYIVTGARCITDSLPENSVAARVSGDEFNVLLYGCESREHALSIIGNIEENFNNTTIMLPDGSIRKVSASGGIAWITDEKIPLRDLVKYADFAMYIVKHENKGAVGEFDADLFYRSELMKRKIAAVTRIIENEEIRYVFQPIVEANTGRIFAYEALMRVEDPEISNLEEFLRIARTVDFHAVERISWFHALAEFRAMIRGDAISPKAKLFINSQVSQRLTGEEMHKLIERFSDIRKNTVMEVVETDDCSSLTDLKENSELFTNSIALDDYGTGYNSEKNLLELMPDYVKLDMALVRNIDRFPKRQELITNLVSFAHNNKMKIIAEGIETEEELQTLRSIGVDLLQGYLIATPASVPGPLSYDVVEMLRRRPRR